MDNRRYVIKCYDTRKKLWESISEERFTLREVVDFLEENLQSDEGDD